MVRGSGGGRFVGLLLLEGLVFCTVGEDISLRLEMTAGAGEGEQGACVLFDRQGGGT